MSILESAAAFSSYIAPAIDRVAISVHSAVDKERVAALRGDNKFHPGAMALFAGPLATGGMSAYEFRELTRYEHFGPGQPLVDGLVSRGALSIGADGQVETRAEAIAVCRALVVLQCEAVTKLFSPRADLVAPTRALIDRAKAVPKGTD